MSEHLKTTTIIEQKREPEYHFSFNKYPFSFDIARCKTQIFVPTNSRTIVQYAIKLAEETGEQVWLFPEQHKHPKDIEVVCKHIQSCERTNYSGGITGTSSVVTWSPYVISWFEPEQCTLVFETLEYEVSTIRFHEIPVVMRQLKTFKLGEIWPAEEEAMIAYANERLSKKDA